MTGTQPFNCGCGLLEKNLSIHRWVIWSLYVTLYERIWVSKLAQVGRTVFKI